MIRFKKVVFIADMAVRNESTVWHLENGWVYNCYSDERLLGCIACSISAGCLVYLHAHILPGAAVGPVLFYRAFRAALFMLGRTASAIFITIPDGDTGLRDLAVKAGFVTVWPGFYSDPDGAEMRMMRAPADFFSIRK